jgi:hypothetical protein
MPTTAKTQAGAMTGSSSGDLHDLGMKHSGLVSNRDRFNDNSFELRCYQYHLLQHCMYVILPGKSWFITTET